MSILPDKIQRYQKFISFMLKYWNSDVFEYATTNAFDIPTDKIDSHNFNQSPKELVNDLKNMGPTYIKLGQLLSTRPDLLPKPYLTALEDLQDNVAPVSFFEIKRTVEEELNAELDTIFKNFQKAPIASASIGQVHKATLMTGEEVAVKIQRPEIKQQFIDDIRTLERIINLALKHTIVARKYAFDDVLDELRQVLFQELNYKSEANNLLILYNNLKEYTDLIVPLPLTDYSSVRVLTMQFVKGKKITDVPVTSMKSDPKVLAFNLASAYLQQIFQDGFVHVDPHPGNVLYTSDHKIALIDLGMAARFSKDMQGYLMQLLLAMTQKKTKNVADILLAISEVHHEADLTGFKKKITHLVVNQHLDTTRDMEIGKSLIQLNRIAAEHYVRLPVSIYILGKVLLNIEQIIYKLDPTFNIEEAIEKNLLKILKKNIKEELKLENLMALLIDGERLIQNFPKRLYDISKHLADNNFKVKIEAINEKRVTEGFQKVANRIALGLIIAAMIVGAAMLMRIPSNFTLFGYPGMAMIFFLLAALGGIVLSLIIIVKDEG